MRLPTKTIRTIALAAILVAIAPAASLAAPAQHVIRYDGVTLRVPRGWQVISLSKHPSTCVRFNRRAVYLGTPSAEQNCPANEIGRAQAILIEPGRGGVARIVRSADPQLSGVTHGRTAESARARPAQASTPYVGKGFDACRTPSIQTLERFTTTKTEVYRAVGMYIGGANLGCMQPNVTPALVTWAEENGWHLIPTYVGLQAPNTSCSCQTIPESAKQDIELGQDAATSAVAEMQALGLGPGNPIYYDMEAYKQGGKDTAAALSFEQAWTQQLHADGYLSGVYGSGDSTIYDLVNNYGPNYLEPDEVWYATFDKDPTDWESLPESDWASQRLNQWDNDQSLEGMSVDYDYVDGATAPNMINALPPTTSPLLALSAAADGQLSAVTGWTPPSTTVPITSWELLGGNDPSALAPLASVLYPIAPRPTLTTGSAFEYYDIEALSSTSTVIGTSPPVLAPAHLAVYGGRAFVSVTTGASRLPVGCFLQTSCSLRLTVTADRQMIVSSPPLALASGADGSLGFSLNPVGRELLVRHHNLRATATLTDIGGKHVSVPLILTAYKTSGTSPARSSDPLATLRVDGRTAFVVGRVGGVLVACTGPVPCQVTTTINSLFGSTLAQTGVETFGANELGYLYFTLSKQADKLLDSTAGNQLPIQVTMVNQVPALSIGFGQAGTATAASVLTQAY
jgi:hypothetical protein